MQKNALRDIFSYVTNFNLELIKLSTFITPHIALNPPIFQQIISIALSPRYASYFIVHIFRYSVHSFLSLKKTGKVILNTKTS